MFGFEEVVVGRKGKFSRDAKSRFWRGGCGSNELTKQLCIWSDKLPYCFFHCNSSSVLYCCLLYQTWFEF